jgi:septal ring-binding cell division protein DamX
VKFCFFTVALRMTSRWRLNRLLSFFNAVRRTSSAQHSRQRSEARGSTPSKLHQCGLASTTNSAPNNNGIVSTSSSIPLTPRETRQGNAPTSMHRTGSAARSPFILSCLFMLCVRRAT